MLLLLACTGSPDKAPADDTATTQDSDTGESGDTAVEVDDCTPRGLTRRAWDSSGVDGAFDTVAPDFTVNLMDGTQWSYADAFTGCDSVVAVRYDPDLSMAYPDFSQRGDIKDWLEASPPNVDYLIFVSSMREADRLETLTTIKDKVDAAIGVLDDPDLADWWTARVHYVTDNPDNADGAAWVGDLYQAYSGAGVPVNFGIDRFQVVRELGYLADPVTGWSEAPPAFLAYDVEWFNQQSDLQDRLDAEGATVLRPFEETSERTAVEIGRAHV